MATNSNINRAPESTPTPEKAEKSEQIKDSKEVSGLKESVGGAAVMETVDVGEESAETMGHVSEVLSSTVSEDKRGRGGGKKDDQGFIDPEELRKRLLSKVPPAPEMRRQIEKEIRKEIDYLHRKAMRMLRSTGSVNYFEMNNIVKKIRELKSLLLILVKASVDSLKSLWLRYVHGIM